MFSICFIGLFMFHILLLTRLRLTGASNEKKDDWKLSCFSVCHKLNFFKLTKQHPYEFFKLVSATLCCQYVTHTTRRTSHSWTYCVTASVYVSTLVRSRKSLSPYVKCVVHTYIHNKLTICTFVVTHYTSPLCCFVFWSKST